MKLHEVNIKLTKSQILKIINDEAFDFKHEHIGHGRHVLYLKPKTINKLDKVKNKIHLDWTEREKTLEGNGLGHFINSIKRGVKHIASDIKSTAKKYCPTIESHLIHEGIPATTGVLGSVIGGPGGAIIGKVAGEEIANVVGEKAGRGMRIVKRKYKKGSVEMKEKMAKLRELKARKEQKEEKEEYVEKEGEGLFKTLHKIGISRKDVKHAGKVIGKTAANMAIDSVAEIANSYGVPVPSTVTESLKKATDHLIDGRHKDAINAVKEPAKVIMKEKIQLQVDKLPIEVQPYLEEKIVSLGLGLKKKHGRVVKGGTLKITRKPKKMYDSNVHSMLLNKDDEETFSPFLNSSNPAMNPYISMVNSYVKQVPLTKGSGLYGPSSGHGLF